MKIGVFFLWLTKIIFSVNFCPDLCPSKNCTIPNRPATATEYQPESLVTNANIIGKIEPIAIPI